MKNNINNRKNITDVKKRIFFCFIKPSFDKYLEENRREITSNYNVDIKNDSEAIYECAQGAWKINKKRLPFIEYVFALYQGKVIGIYKVSKKSWFHRTELDNVDKNVFPTIPSIRESELQYSIVLKNCTNEETDIKRILENNNLSYTHLCKDIISPHKFKDWKNRYFFKKENDSIDSDIYDFLNKQLVFPNGNGTERLIYRNEHYNFDSNGELKKYE